MTNIQEIKKEEFMDSDDEFMEEISEEPLTPENAKKRRESLMAGMENSQKIVDSLKDLAEANKSGALKILKDKVKDTLTSSLEVEDIKELKDGVKQLEAVKVTLGLIETLCSQYTMALTDIDKYKQQLEDLKELQPALPLSAN